MRRLFLGACVIAATMLGSVAFAGPARAEDFSWHNLVQDDRDGGLIFGDLVTIRDDGLAYVYADNGVSQPERTAGYVGPDVNAILMPGDWDGDGYADWIYRSTDGSLHRMPGWSGGTPRNQIGWGWDVMTALTSPGDWDGDGAPDVLARDASGALWLYRGDGDGHWYPGRTQVGSGWNIMNAIFSGHDFNGDGSSDVLARDVYDALWLYPGNGTGGWQNRVQIGRGWQSMAKFAAPGDFDRDGVGDVIAQDINGKVWLYPGNGTGGFTGQRFLMDVPASKVMG
ncbi:FG-GAP repeat domain-containing protein [Paenarthrobacter sp. YJN-5]|uniref:FG-GAP repeat domain-containing protein n=1 Tax=unclassified Paenarthrobacter TaxID=2634190 RepID=UPI001D0CB41A|nr:VCBS repeat-containing protein [Paenarthrobacter sp. YJN-5]